MRLKYIFILFAVIGVAFGHKMSLRRFGKKHLKTNFHKLGLMSGLKILPLFFSGASYDDPVKQIVVVPESNDLNNPSGARISRMLEGLDTERLAREWPDSVTPGGPGPEWW